MILLPQSYRPHHPNLEFRKFTDINKKSSISVQFCSYFQGLIYPLVGQSLKVWTKLDQNCGFSINSFLFQNSKLGWWGLYFWWKKFSTSLKSKSQKNFDITNIPFLSVNKFWYAPFQNFKSLHIKSQLSMLLLTFCEIRKTTQLKKKVFLTCHILYFFLWQCKDHKASSPNISRSIAHIELFGKARDTA